MSKFEERVNQAAQERNHDLEVKALEEIELQGKALMLGKGVVSYLESTGLPTVNFLEHTLDGKVFVSGRASTNPIYGPAYYPDSYADNWVYKIVEEGWHISTNYMWDDAVMRDGGLAISTEGRLRKLSELTIEEVRLAKNEQVNDSDIIIESRETWSRNPRLAIETISSERSKFPKLVEELVRTGKPVSTGL